MWYTLPNNTKHYPLTIERVKEIKKLNQQGIAVEELQAVEVTSGKPKEVEPDFVDVVGQISLRTLEKNDRRRRDQQGRPNNRGGEQRGPQQSNRPGPSQGNRPMNAQGPRKNPNNNPNRPPQGQNRPQGPNNRPPQGPQGTSKPAGEQPSEG